MCFNLENKESICYEREGDFMNEISFELEDFQKDYKDKLQEVNMFIKDPKKCKAQDTHERLVNKFLKLYEERTVEK